MADRSLRKRLSRLFATNVVVRRLGKDRLRVIDSNRLQSTGNINNTRYLDRFGGRVHSSRPPYSANNVINYHSSKVELYTDYEAMDRDPIIAAALDIYADETTLKDSEGDILEISTPDANIKKILYNLFYDIMNIDYNLWPWVRNLCKYGDFYLHLDIEEEIGIVNVSPLSGYEMEREEGFDPANPYAYCFQYTGEYSGELMSYGTYHRRRKMEAYEVAHFRLLSDTNFLPYGKAAIEPARKVFKQLTLMEDAMLIQRIMRAPERRLFYIDVGNIPDSEIENHMNQIMARMKKIPYIDQQTGDYNLKFNIQNMLEDFYLPVRGGESGTKIENLPGLGNEGQIEDIEYLRKKMMAYLKIPSAYLGYDAETDGKATLAAEDVQFARTIERIQRIVESELTKIAIIHLFTQGFSDHDLVNFQLKLTSPSIIYEKQKIDLLTQQMDLAEKMKESRLFSRKYIYENIFGLSEDEWQQETRLVIGDLQENFRMEQIENEGNDPKKTGISFGTPHDIAAMHVSARSIGSGPVPGTGRPEEPGLFGKHKDDFTRDPLGQKDLRVTFDDSITNQRPERNPFGEGSYDYLLRTLETHKSAVTQTLITEASDTENTASEGILDETNIFEENI